MYIAIEGIDCAGKSTQIALLLESFNNAIITREPGGTEFGKIIREIVLNNNHISELTRFMLFLADRAEHIDKVVLPAIKMQRHIISDRSFISGMAYYLENTHCDIKQVFELNKFATSNIMPEKTIFLNVSQDTLIARLNTKELDAIESKGVEFLLSVQNNIKKSLDYCKLDYIEIDASLEIDLINKQILGFLNK